MNSSPKVVTGDIETRTVPVIMVQIWHQNSLRGGGTGCDLPPRYYTDQKSFIT
jgi:hypothetical protein